MSGPFPVRGVIEGFYGPPYTHPQRLDLIRFLGAHGFDLYVYAPKNDRKHRSRWREPYAPAALARFEETVRAAHEAGVEFCYALSPGADLRYSSDEDVELVMAKLATFRELGVRSFSLLLDDIASRFRHEEDERHFGSYAEAQAELCNRVHERFGRDGGGLPLSMCPTAYHGTAPFGPYLHELGARLDPEIDVFYTGPDVCSPSISVADARAFAAAVARPPLVWDNYPVNDLAMQGELHIGPVRGRDPALFDATRGIVVNPMLQPEASKVPLATFADYLRDPAGYEPEASWDWALALVAGTESAPALRLLAENSLHSCLGTPEAAELSALADAALAALEEGEDPRSAPRVDRLRGYLGALDEACDHLKVDLANLALRQELLPWIDALESRVGLGLFSLEVLAAHRAGAPADGPRRRVEELRGQVAAHHKRMAKGVLEPLAALALRPARRGVPS